MEAVRTLETSVSFYRTACRSIPEDSHLHTPAVRTTCQHLVLELSARLREDQSAVNVAVAVTVSACIMMTEDQERKGHLEVVI